MTARKPVSDPLRPVRPRIASGEAARIEALEAELAQWRAIGRNMLDDLKEPADVQAALTRVQTDMRRLLGGRVDTIIA